MSSMMAPKVRSVGGPGPAHREFIRNRLPNHMAAHLDRELCPSCASQRADRPAVGASSRPR